MIFLVTFYLLFLILLFFFTKKNYKLFGYKQYNILFPINILLLFSALAVPYMYIIISNPTIIYTSIDPNDVDGLLFKYIILQTFSIILFIIGAKSFWYRAFSNFMGSFDNVVVKHNRNILVILSVLFYILFYYNIKSLDLDNIFQIFVNRNENVSKLGYVYYAQQIIGYYVLYLFLLKDKFRGLQKINLVLFFIALLIASLLTGGRTQIIYILIFCFIVIQSKRQISFKQIFKFKYIFVATLLLSIIYIIPKFRGNAAGNNESVESVLTTKDDQSYKSSQLLADLSGLDRYLFVIDMFDKNTLWYGEGYLDIVKILAHPFTGSDINDVPKGDDGLYLAVMSYERKFISKPYRVDDLYKTSYPPGNYAAYMNFGIIGLLFSFYFLGGIANTFYMGCRKGRFKYIYFYTLFIGGSLAFSNNSILNVIINIMTLLIVLLIIKILNPANVKFIKQ